MVVRRLIVAIASLVASISLLAFVLSRVLLGIAGSAEATAGLAEELIDLPPVREAIAEEVVDRLMEEPEIAEIGTQWMRASPISSIPRWRRSGGYRSSSSRKAT